MNNALTEIEKNLLQQLGELHSPDNVAFSLRKNGETVELNSTKTIELKQKKDKNGLDINIKFDTRQQVLHIPVIISQTKMAEVVFNDFVVEDNCDVVIVAGCGIHADLDTSEHNGKHNFVIGKNCKVKYIETHVGTGANNAGKVISPLTSITLGENSFLEMVTHQIGGVNIANRETNIVLNNNAKAVINEKILTENFDQCNSKITVELNGKNASCEVKSRVVAKGKSKQCFESVLKGNNVCFGRVECDGIILDEATISSTPAIIANCKDAMLGHEAQIGKIAGDQLIKLMTLGLTEKEAENTIIKGYLK